MAATAQGSLALAELLRFLPQTTAVRDFFRSATEAYHQVVAKQATDLAVTGLSHRYEGRDRDAIAQISLSARRGEMIALVGVNGAGRPRQ